MVKMVAATDTHDRGKSFSTGRGGQLAKVAKKGRHDNARPSRVAHDLPHGFRVRCTICASRLKESRSVQPIAGDELGAIKRYFATRTYDLPWCFAPTVGQMSRQAVNSPIDQCLRGRRLKNVHPHTLLHSSAAIWSTEARICGLNGIISA